MTDYADFTAMLVEYENRPDWSPVVIMGYVRQAESYLNRDLRIDWMIQEDVGTLVDRSVALPLDWLMADFIQFADTGYSIRYKSRDEFYNSTDAQMYGYYTIKGRKLVLGGPPNVDGIQVTMSYYGQVPAFSDTQPSWLYSEFLDLYLNASRMFAKGHAVGEEQTAAGYKALVDETVGKLNAQHLVSKASGSRVTRTRLRALG